MPAWGSSPPPRRPLQNGPMLDAARAADGRELVRVARLALHCYGDGILGVEPHAPAGLAVTADVATLPLLREHAAAICAAIEKATGRRLATFRLAAAADAE
jgi:hypothetical protein